MSFSKAKRTCAVMGGSLAYFDSEEEYNVFRAGRSAERNDWIGIKRNSRLFKTVAKTIPSWTNWKDGEPSMDDTTKACVKAGYTGRWNDEDCNTKFQVTCRFEDSSYCELY
ncbi:Oidioi.mRNA.OKI2018_I69.chr2.g7647.t1.cds [Oikopleura dioica]|uniref:Oidioi.mRNA.OKI2018_I69.chr2.g7647.t1.cds n=1 Tax=Oikopleura dioica TaxID=34765 RepID=A0ABN7T7C1_OIKDI|nr:Oidioi.mRNA.OKI2018_I69.chr2.g7647.t1.cds [Oikopleura dioica]